MELDKIRNLSDIELGVEGNKTAEQLFRLRFQVKLGQTDGVKKLRTLKKDIARMKTVARERELGLHGAEHKTESSAPAKSKARKAPKKVAAKTSTKRAAPKKKVAKKSTKKGAR